MSNAPFQALRIPPPFSPSRLHFLERTPVRSAGIVRRSSDRKSGSGEPADYALIAFCHLSWDWVWQRPQQFLSRLAAKRPLLFIETHCRDLEQSSIVTRSVAGHPNVTIMQMLLPAKRWGDGVFIDRERRRLLKDYVTSDDGRKFERPVLWFNDPMAVTAFAGHMGERAIVYDCMDELSQFRGAPPELLEREEKLLRVADVVFCGGRKMRDKRLPLNANTHFYGTGVDCGHFGRALERELETEPEIAALGQSVLGYFGVVDERLDYELIAKLADARKDWQVAIVGPAVKVDPADFPRRDNLHWLGGRAYAHLPAITKGFSVCLMPFALNAATEYINPTKALEYMAAGKPVVSTALDEVRTNFRSVARIGQTHDEFIALALAEVASPSAVRIKRGLKLAAENTWEVIAAKMENHIAEVLEVREAEAVKIQPAPTRAAALPAGLSYV